MEAAKWQIAFFYGREFTPRFFAGGDYSSCLFFGVLPYMAGSAWRLILSIKQVWTMAWF